MRAQKMFEKAVQTEKCFPMFDEMFAADRSQLSNTIQHDSTRSNMMSKREIFGHKTIFERV